MLFAFAAISLSFASCGDDDEDVPVDPITGGTVAKFTTKTDKEIVLTLESALCTQKHSTKFESKKLTSYLYTASYATNEMAQTAYKDCENDSTMPDVKLNGKTITCDYTPLWKGMDYDIVLKTLEAIKDQTNSHNKK